MGLAAGFFEGAFDFGLEVLEATLGVAFLTGALGLDALEVVLALLELLTAPSQSGSTPYLLWIAARRLRKSSMSVSPFS